MSLNPKDPVRCMLTTKSLRHSDRKIQHHLRGRSIRQFLAGVGESQGSGFLPSIVATLGPSSWVPTKLAYQKRPIFPVHSNFRAVPSHSCSPRNVSCSPLRSSPKHPSASQSVWDARAAPRQDRSQPATPKHFRENT